MANQTFSVLLVDDDPHACEIFQLVMNYHRLPLEIINNPEEALKYLKINHPDIVVIDLFLPGLDGYQMFEKIRQQELAPKAKYVATTAYYTNDTQHEVLTRGFDGYIAKPFMTTDLVHYLRNLTG